MLKRTTHSSTPSAPMGPGMRFFMTIIFPWIFILVGGGIMYAGVTNLRNASASKNWPTVPGKVVISEVDRHRSEKGSTNYSANVVYDYQVEGTTYSAKRVSFGDSRSSNPAGARTIQNKYKLGTEVLVHYSPKDPSLAVLEPGVSGVTLLLPGIGAVFFLVGCAMAYYLPSAIKKDEAPRVNA